MEVVVDQLQRGARAGAFPDELLAALAVVYFRCLADYQDEGHPVGAPIRVAQDFYTTMYANAEVV